MSVERFLAALEMTSWLQNSVTCAEQPGRDTLQIICTQVGAVNINRQMVPCEARKKSRTPESPASLYAHSMDITRPWPR
jgi:hypothetical protein